MENLKEQIQELQKIIDTYDNIVFFGGAGVSTESGIPDFRSVDGLYHQQYDYPPETILSHSFYRSHPEEFFRFYRNKMLFPKAQPNAAHKKLAELERAGKGRAVITQNIDGLHQAAGSKTVLELHGSVLRNYCEKCHQFYGLNAILNSWRRNVFAPSRCAQQHAEHRKRGADNKRGAHNRPRCRARCADKQSGGVRVGFLSISPPVRLRG